MTRSALDRRLPRREVLKAGAFLGLAGAIGSLAAACGSRSAPPVASGSPRSITLLTGGGDPMAEPGLKRAYDDFRAQHPGFEWDIRAIPGGGPEWDRLARAAIASGEPIGLLTINGQQLGGWAHDDLLADLGSDPQLAPILARVPDQFHLAGPGETTTRAFPLALTRGVHTTGLFYNRAILDQAGLEPPTTIDDMKAMVEPLAALDVAPLVHCSGDVFFNQVLITWLLPMIAERKSDPITFAESTVKGDVGYDSPEWIEAFGTITDLRTSGVLMEGSGATDYATMQQLMLHGRAAMTFNGTWLLPLLQGGTPAGPFDLHAAPPPLVEDAAGPRPILAWGGYAMPTQATPSRDLVYEFLEYASRPEVDRAVVEATQAYSPIAESNAAIKDEVAREFLPMFDDAITPLDWLWEPQIKDEIDNQVQMLVKGETDAGAAGAAVQAVAEDLRSTGRGYFS